MSLNELINTGGERRVTDPRSGGQKGQKIARFDLIPFAFLSALARLFGQGALKYADDNWRRGYAWRLSLGALQRHLIDEWCQGRSWDTPDGRKDTPFNPAVYTGAHHLVCVAWHAAVLFTFETLGLGTDDIPERRRDTVPCPPPSSRAPSPVPAVCKYPAGAKVRVTRGPNAGSVGTVDSVNHEAWQYRVTLASSRTSDGTPVWHGGWYSADQLESVP